jgi:hypothetical protein
MLKNNEVDGQIDFLNNASPNGSPGLPSALE